MKKRLAASMIILSGLLFSQLSFSAPEPSKARNPRQESKFSKTGNYIAEGFFAGGEKSVTAVRLKDIRRAKSNEGYERVVLDLEALTENKGKAIPYFQVQASPQENRVVLSIWSDVTYDYDSQRVQRSFAKSGHIKKLNVVPRVEDGLATIEFVLNEGKKSKLEVFQLTNPARIIMDIL